MKTRWAFGWAVPLISERSFATLPTVFALFPFRWAPRLEACLDDGLAMLEKAACSSLHTDQRAVDRWKGLLLDVLAPDHKFVGRAFSFSVTAPDLIVDHLMTEHPYHENGHKDVVFAISVRCFAHYGTSADPN